MLHSVCSVDLLMALIMLEPFRSARHSSRHCRGDSAARGMSSSDDGEVIGDSQARSWLPVYAADGDQVVVAKERGNLWMVVEQPVGHFVASLDAGRARPNPIWIVDDARFSHSCAIPIHTFLSAA